MIKRGFLIVFLIIFILAVLMTVSCQNNQQANGTLKGTVTIGPIWPVERPGGNPPVSPQVFEARKVVIYDKSHTQILEKVNLVQIGVSAQASYIVQLKPGSYMVDISKNGMDRSGEVPAKVEIRSGETVTIDISIDTGIR